MHEDDVLLNGHVDREGWLAVYAGMVARSSAAMAMTVGAGHTVQAINAGFARLLQRDAPPLLNQPLGDVVPATQRAGIVALLDQVFRTGDPVVAAALQHVHPARGMVYWTYTVWPLLMSHGLPAGVLVVVYDTTAAEVARRQAEEAGHDLRLVNEQLLLAGLREQELATAATQQALHDGLTGLPNRTLLLNRLAQALEATNRTHCPCALLFLDLDRFKTINDSLGHLAGDDFLRQIARRLAACVRPQDTVARLGGDEFALLLMDMPHINEVIHIADRVQQQVAVPIHLDGQEIVTSASIGIVLSTPAYRQPAELLRDADIALYRAKALGKARYVVFDPTMHAEAVALVQLETDLHRAVMRQEFTLYYQPIVSLHTGTLRGVEALVRWQHPERGCLTPEAFLGAAEDTGVIIPITEWALHTACAQMRAWHAAGFPPVYVAVNLSARHLKRRNLAPRIAQIVHDTGLPPQYVHIELTETSVMENITTSIATLQALTALGMQVAVDDFGTGYSSLSYLKRLPLTTVKVDRTFVDHITDDPNDAAIAAATIAMAHRLGLQVVAEGVETAAQVRHLQAEQCDAVQGYLISPPVPAAALTEWLADGNWLPPRTVQRGG